MSEQIIEIKDDSFEEVIGSSKVPVLVDFWAPWCGPCRSIGPILEELVKIFNDKIVIGKCNIDENPEMPRQFGVKSIPTLMFFDGGEMVERIVGGTSQADLEAVINKVISGEKMVSPLVVH